MTDYRSMYENKCKQFEQLTEQYAQLQEQTNIIINDLEDQLKQTRRKNEQMNRDMNQHREKSKCFKSTIEREVELAQKERNEFKKKFIEFQKKVIELEIVNQSLESELRATKARLNEYESQTERTMEELAFAQIELEQTNQSNKETVARLRGQLKQAEEELFALQKLRQKAQTAKQQVIGASELGNVQTGGKQLFRETMKGIRDYLDELDNRKSEARKMLFKICSQ